MLKSLLENYIALADTIIKVKPAGAKGQYIKSITLSNTMGPGYPCGCAEGQQQQIIVAYKLNQKIIGPVTAGAKA
jgi:hypothetical protein